MTTDRSMASAIGGTPLVQLGSVVPEGAADVFVKLEWYNPTGSYKDRMALETIEAAERRGDLRKGMTLVEYTGGSTGSSLAFACAVKGYRFVAVSSDAYAAEKLKTIQAFGAELVIVESEGGKITRDLMDRMIARATELAEDPEFYFTDQLNNGDMRAGYRSVGHEITDQLEGQIDAFCAAVGTAHFAMGTVEGLIERGIGPKVVLFEPASSAVLSGSEPGTHRVEGIAIGFVPPMLDLELVDEVRTIDEQSARAMARRLTEEEGLFGGISSGLNVVGAIEVAKELGSGHKVVTAAVDTGLKYLAGDLYRR